MEADVLRNDFLNVLRSARNLTADDHAQRTLITRSIYTLQQCIGATLDALPANASNTARKVNGDLFERLIQLLVREAGVSCLTATVQVPVYVENQLQFRMSFQHDLLLYNANELKVIGSVKTSSKDRTDKIFLDKFLYCKPTETALPHIAIFLNDVQRKPGRSDNEYAVNATFLSGHFKGFTVKLNPLDGVYYCDIRPSMRTDKMLQQHIFTIDRFFCSDLWQFLELEGTFDAALWAMQEVLYLDLRERIIHERGWEFNALGYTQPMGARGMSAKEIVDELLVIEIEVWKRIAQDSEGRWIKQHGR